MVRCVLPCGRGWVSVLPWDTPRTLRTALAGAFVILLSRRCWPANRNVFLFLTTAWACPPGRPLGFPGRGERDVAGFPKLPGPSRSSAPLGSAPVAPSKGCPMCAVRRAGHVQWQMVAYIDVDTRIGCGRAKNILHDPRHTHRQLRLRSPSLMRMAWDTALAVQSWPD